MLTGEWDSWLALIRNEDVHFVDGLPRVFYRHQNQLMQKASLRANSPRQLTFIESTLRGLSEVRGRTSLRKGVMLGPAYSAEKGLRVVSKAHDAGLVDPDSLRYGYGLGDPIGIGGYLGDATSFLIMLFMDCLIHFVCDEIVKYKDGTIPSSHFTI